VAGNEKARQQDSKEELPKSGADSKRKVKRVGLKKQKAPSGKRRSGQPTSKKGRKKKQEKGETPRNRSRKKKEKGVEEDSMVRSGGTEKPKTRTGEGGADRETGGACRFQKTPGREHNKMRGFK